MTRAVGGAHAAELRVAAVEPLVLTRAVNSGNEDAQQDRTVLALVLCATRRRPTTTASVHVRYNIVLPLVLCISACRQAPSAGNVRVLPTAPAGVSFVALRAATQREAAQQLSGTYYVHPDHIVVLVTGGALHVMGANLRIEDIRAGIATGDTTVHAGWSTPRLSDVRRARDLPLAPDGSVRDTIRFLIPRTSNFRLSDYWLTFQFHGTLNVPAYGGWVEAVNWIQSSRRFGIVPE